MKKSISFIAALTLASSLVSALPSFADNTTTGGSTELTKIVGASYTVTIPDTLEMGANDTTTSMNVSASDIRIGFGEKLKVAVSSESDWYLVDEKSDSNKEPYTVKLNDSEDALSNNATILDIDKDSESKTATLNVAAPGSFSYSGTYKDTLTFTVTVA